jgi:hypothetical protein
MAGIAVADRVGALPMKGIPMNSLVTPAQPRCLAMAPCYSEFIREMKP